MDIPSLVGHSSNGTNIADTSWCRDHQNTSGAGDDILVCTRILRTYTANPSKSAHLALRGCGGTVDDSSNLFIAPGYFSFVPSSLYFSSPRIMYNTYCCLVAASAAAHTCCLSVVLSSIVRPVLHGLRKKRRTGADIMSNCPHHSMDADGRVGGDNISVLSCGLLAWRRENRFINGNRLKEACHY